MTDTPKEDILTKNQNQLIRFASFANFFSWLVPIVYILYTGAIFINQQQSYTISLSALQAYSTLLTMSPLYIASKVIHLIYILFQGVVYWIILKGIALGINLIVEIDIDRNMVEEDENHC
jgi:hypothetical protein